ncbi:putative uncharacterized protein C12orf77 [Camelus dromedarius]|uniref:Uncharacterized protein n=1 Tax=Camelus dromedarius TaxID=9838 RepID=A0A5N4C738_CAMDR|nr:putative uncharacterized protein C12orf77 [Camelus dromedarius]
MESRGPAGSDDVGGANIYLVVRSEVRDKRRRGKTLISYTCLFGLAKMRRGGRKGSIRARDLLINPQIPKPATPRDICLLVIKEASGRARNNIQILNPLDYIACLTNYTFFPLDVNVSYLMFLRAAKGVT